MKNKINFSKNQIIIGIVILIVVIIVLIGSFGTKSGLFGGGQIYSNQDYGIKFSYPNDWKVTDNNGANGFFMLSCQKNDVANANLSVQILGVGDVSLADYTNGFLNGSLKKEKIVDSSDVTFANNPGHQITYEATSKSADGVGKYTLVYTVKGEKSYLVNFSGGIDNYDSLMPAVKRIIASFEITK